ncbi:hypothetical protein M422DRAFT_50492 [Sphaerobolus stellatus SS14]|uniref:Uncharacterized protein n=1 Tax=Sphaerobolus stellatus (strain SS14) TaxID=990650 RepID=A0A0C9URL3_SPHS4|nr:hypothetical protein M422DRAFT_50492 [Sphaerobolus stellatus SS14]
MDTFSWADAARAVFGPCLQCLPGPRETGSDDDEQQPQRPVRREELESLLQNPGFSDGEMEADAVSLHSQIGRTGGVRRPRKKRGKKKGNIRLFGYDLFGRPLQLDEESDAEDQAEDQRRISRMSSSTLDSDAAPLADDSIARLAAEAEARQEAEAARKARKERRKQKKIAALLNTQNSEFEGFLGSGPAGDDFGAFQAASSPTSPDPDFIHVERGGADDADADADFGAGSYVRNTSRRSDSGSGTRSRTSASVSNTQELSIPAHLIPLPPSSAGSSSGLRKKSKKSGKRSQTTGSSATSSQPRSPTAFSPAPHIGIVSPTWSTHPRSIEFEGVPADDDFTTPSPTLSKVSGQTAHGESEFSTSAFPSPGLSSGQGFPTPGFSRSNAFPSVGFGGRRNSSLGGGGAFLARTGDDE